MFLQEGFSGQFRPFLLTNLIRMISTIVFVRAAPFLCAIKIPTKRMKLHWEVHFETRENINLTAKKITAKILWSLEVFAQ